VNCSSRRAAVVRFGYNQQVGNKFGSSVSFSAQVIELLATQKNPRFDDEYIEKFRRAKSGLRLDFVGYAICGVATVPFLFLAITVILSFTCGRRCRLGDP
jgi:hypothetical protein